MTRPAVTPRVSVVIPTVGRASLARAVRSVLDQTYRPAEILVVADTDAPLSLPADERIVQLRPGVGAGPARCRQLGINAATGRVIALLDDDDEWRPDKLRRQLDAVAACAGDQWIASCRMDVEGPGDRRRTWPRRIIEPGQSVAEYLFRFTDLTFGGAVLQTSTLCFPTEVARRVRWDADTGAPHDEPSWLIRVQAAMPGVHFVQLPDVLSTYHVDGESLSRSTVDRTDAYIGWGLQYLSGESPRVRGDYLCTSPVSAAVSARSVRGVRHSISAALRHGRPGPWALGYAAMNTARVLTLRARAAVRPAERRPATAQSP
ncbi:glycosyltransferase family 2 protein [Rhodococcus tukisamuensis]|uniref:Glycosyltransferase involved in cell wall bisynthesis n=1 Tax=Rhodococcus tukisamuensis TaxID=168276 RepID=A0A1G7AL58_9NOCA|nr:glycosyltransferase family A protein [Rhodococcus tukisamuensis]SDE15561.1 Glycosyltransferase involved in cell wall bisynthesis [Rhodococcus tukisamuensis]